MNRELMYLKNLYSSKSIRKLSKIYKKMYKYSLCAVFFNIISCNHRTVNQEDNFKIIETIKILYKTNENADSIFNNIIKPPVEYYFEKIGGLGPFDDEKVDKIIEFMREKINILIEEEICLFQVKELSYLFDIKTFLGIEILSEHNWIELNLTAGLVITVPELIIFNDFKIAWNNFVETKLYIDNEMENRTTNEKIIDFYKSDNNRIMGYKLGTYYRNLIFLSVSFVESYLYNLFCTIEESSVVEKTKTNWNFNNKTISDIQILDDILFKMYVNIENHISNEYSNYRKLLHLRNRYVHAIPTINETDQSSNIKPLLDINVELLVELLQSSIVMVDKIQSILPEEFKILFWWDSNVFYFADFKPFQITKPNSRFENFKYEKNP